MLNWNTVYISGQGDFRDDVRRKLEHYLPNGSTMPGFIGALDVPGTHDMYWVNVSLTLREIKEAIGAKLIWKHRLRFYLTLEEFMHAHQRLEEADLQRPAHMEGYPRNEAA